MGPEVGEDPKTPQVGVRPPRRESTAPDSSESSGGTTASEDLLKPADFWEQACRLLVLLVLFLVPCIYPLNLPEAFVTALRNDDPDISWKFLRTLYDTWHWFYLGQIDTFVQFGYAPLPLKEGVFTVLVVLLLVCWCAHQFVESGRVGDTSRRRFDWVIYGPIAALLAWGAISLLWTPTFFYSLKTFAMMAAGVLWFAIIHEMRKDARLIRRWFDMILLAGGIVAFFAFLQDIDRNHVITGLIFTNLDEPAKSDPFLLRLRMGSLIGHNIGVASFISFSWFILIARLFQQATWKRKAARAVFLIFLFNVIVALQTRGIWITLALLTPIYIVWLLRLTGKRWDLKPILGAVLIGLIILTAQFIPSPRNPFYSPSTPLLSRLTHFRLSHLLTDTRLRIAVCSGPLLAEKPLTGHGLGSFQYVFPKAQGDYFARHPDTIIVPSSHRTMRAHNDWLQILIELGIPGLLIALCGLGLVLRRGWDEWNRIRDPRLKIETTAALMGAACVAIHGLGNFPVHVVSTIVPGTFLLAIWASSGRIGRPPTKAAVPAESEVKRKGKSAVKTTSLAGLGLVLLVPAAIGAVAWFYSLLHASMYESLGTSYRTYYGDRFSELDYPQRHYVILSTYDIFMQGHKKSPLDCQLTFRLGEASVLRGALAFRKWKETLETPGASTKERDKFWVEAVESLQRGIDWLEQCQKEVRNHEVFFYVGMGYEYLYRLSGKSTHRDKAKHNYRLAARYSPAYSRALLRLFELLQGDRPPDEFELRALCRQIAKYDPVLFHEHFVRQLDESIRRRDYLVALEKAQIVLDAQPNVPNHWLKTAHLMSFCGRGADAQRLLDKFPRAFPKIPAGAIVGYRMEAALASGQYEQAVVHSYVAESMTGGNLVAPYCQTIRAIALEKLGKPEAQPLWDEIEQQARTDTRYRTALAEALLFLVRDPQRAYPYLVLAAAGDPPPDAALIRVAAEMSWERDEKQQAVTFLERSLELDPEDPKAQNLLKKWTDETGPETATSPEEVE